MPNRLKLTSRGLSQRPHAAALDEPGPWIDVAAAEDPAFWTWAVVEVLRRTGVRIEEMLERECQKFGVRR